MTTDRTAPVLEGEGDTDYARYMRTDTLLSLQRRPEQAVHRDELLFQTVHQACELWLKLAVAESGEAERRIRAGELLPAERLLRRAALAAELVTGQLEMLESLSPWTFQLIRTVLGHGSGFESPGWSGIHRRGQALDRALTALLAARDADLADVYRGSPDEPLYRLCEALVDWDERIALWRTHHYKIATRIIGHDVVGTKGTPVDTLTRLIVHKYFPQLWAVRTQLTRLGPMASGGTDPAADAADVPDGVS
jgi:tryptophan 2,3-dioxygenase